MTNLSGFAEQTGFLAVILSHSDQSSPCQSSSFLSCALLQLCSLSFSVTFKEIGLNTAQVFISLYTDAYQQITVLSTLQNFMTTASETNLQELREKVGLQ